MLSLLAGAALLGVAYAQNDTLPQIDLGYEIYQAAGFNVCSFSSSFSLVLYMLSKS